jgi:hypothetical protein
MSSCMVCNLNECVHFCEKSALPYLKPGASSALTPLGRRAEVDYYVQMVTGTNIYKKENYKQA